MKDWEQILIINNLLNIILKHLHCILQLFDFIDPQKVA